MDALAVQEPPKTTPAMAADVVPPPAASTARNPNQAPPAPAPGEAEVTQDHHQVPVPHMTEPAPGSSSSSVTTAIIATVIIVLGLAGIAFYAFIQ